MLVAAIRKLVMTPALTQNDDLDRVASDRIVSSLTSRSRTLSSLFSIRSNLSSL